MQRDKYEEQFLAEIKQVSKSMKVDRVELGELRLKRFSAMLFHLIAEKKERFDILISGGNSGIAALKISQMVYQKANITPPPIVVLPVVRPSNNQEIKTDTSNAVEQLKKIKNICKVLFVDDEIMLGQTAKICFETIFDYKKSSNQDNPFLNCTIIAENHFFVWRYELEGIAVRFLPFAMVLQGYNGNFGYLAPIDLQEDIQKVLRKDNLDRNEILAVLLGNTRKITSGNTSEFEEISEKSMQIIKDYPKRKHIFISKIEKLVEEGIEEYKNKKIAFKYLS